MCNCKTLLSNPLGTVGNLSSFIHHHLRSEVLQLDVKRRGCKLGLAVAASKSDLGLLVRGGATRSSGCGEFALDFGSLEAVGGMRCHNKLHVAWSSNKTNYMWGSIQRGVKSLYDKRESVWKGMVHVNLKFFGKLELDGLTLCSSPNLHQVSKLRRCRPWWLCSVTWLVDAFWVFPSRRAHLFQQVPVYLKPVGHFLAKI